MCRLAGRPPPRISSKKNYAISTRSLRARAFYSLIIVRAVGKDAAGSRHAFMRLCLMMTWWLLEHAFTFHASVARSPAAAHQQAHPVLVSSASCGRGISDEARETIIELVQLDFELVAESLQRRHPIAAWELAQSSFEKRWPLLEWTLKYNMDRTALNLVERATNCTLLRAVSPMGYYAELDRQRSHLTSRLTTQRSHLAMALIALRPALRQRLVEAIAERPSLLPSVGRRSLGSGILYLQWVANQRLRRVRTRESFEATRAALIEKWLQALLEVHDRIAPSRAWGVHTRGREALSASDVLWRWIEQAKADLTTLTTGLTTTLYADEEWARPVLAAVPEGARGSGGSSAGGDGRRTSRWRWWMRWRPTPPALGVSWPFSSWRAKWKEQWRACRADAYLVSGRLALWPMRRVRPMVLALILIAAHYSAASQRLGWCARSMLRRTVRGGDDMRPTGWERGGAGGWRKLV